jgi:RNA recognition motif-containing protein
VVKLSKYIGDDNRERCLVMRGCPWKVTAEEIIGFFDGYGALTSEDIFIEEYNGKRTGSALVIFENREVAQDAKAALQKNEIGAEARYVELYSHEQEFMQKICNLQPSD